MTPIEKIMYKLGGVDPTEEMNWKQFLKALLVINLFWFFWGMILLVSQGVLPLNPDGNLGQSVHQAFNTCISFLVNCNLQHYSGESGAKLSHPVIRYHAVSIHHRCNRYGGNGGYHEGIGR